MWVCSCRPATTLDSRHESLTGFVQQSQITLPYAVRKIYLWRDGQDPSTFTSFVNNMQFVPLSNVLRDKAELDRMIGYEFEQENFWHQAWVPIFQNGGGDSLVVDLHGVHTGTKGQVIAFYHDWEHRSIVAPDLKTLLQGMLKYYEAFQANTINEPHDISDFLPSMSISFKPSGTAAPLY
ncbi:SMI1/KNR4 family protein [Palleronia rufa]|uniref:SMI1/KNR4 family protein n=1 Tax=Palleronia rufa TaxID=1530186 RepID=UPI0038993D80